LQHLYDRCFYFTDDENETDSEGEAEPDPDRENPEMPVLLRRPRFLRVKDRLVNSLEESRNQRNYSRLDPIDPGQHST
jgi:hypothetical protein